MKLHHHVGMADRQPKLFENAMSQATHPKRPASYLQRARRKFALEAVRVLFRRRLDINVERPLISFTFDDFPRTALFEAGSILERYGGLATYYASFGLMGKPSPVGPIYDREDLMQLLDRGHELGCHTFGHCHSWDTPADAYEQSIIENQQALAKMLPGVSFQSFSFPHSAPRLAVKKVASKYFRCCRLGGLKAGRYLHRHAGGSQTFNSGITDLNCLASFFLEKSRDNPQVVKSLIDQNASARGWLIFSTHDVCANPSPYGCTAQFFEQVVQWSLQSGARILPVVKALDLLQSASPK